MDTYEDNAQTRTMAFVGFASTYVGGIALAMALCAFFLRSYEVPPDSWRGIGGTIAIYSAASFVAFLVFGVLLHFNNSLPYGIGMIFGLVGIVATGVLATTPIGRWSLPIGPLIVPTLILIANKIRRGKSE